MYASRTGSGENLEQLRLHGWRLMVSARGVLRHEGFPYALDNGAWTAHQRGEPFDVAAFERAVALLGADADFVVCPDAVGDRDATLAMAAEWLPRLAHLPRVLVAVQDGMTAGDIERWLSPRVGIFIGGTTKQPPEHGGWKEDTAASWGVIARKHGAWCHMGRVSSARRIAICAAAGLDSFDGSGPSRFSSRGAARKLARAASQRALLMPTDPSGPASPPDAATIGPGAPASDPMELGE